MAAETLAMGVSQLTYAQEYSNRQHQKRNRDQETWEQVSILYVIIEPKYIGCWELTCLSTEKWAIVPEVLQLLAYVYENVEGTATA